MSGYSVRHSHQGVGTLTVALLVSGILAWAIVLATILFVLLWPNGRPALAGLIDTWQIDLPFYGRLTGEAAIAKFVEKLAMLAFAIVPVLLLETAVCGYRGGSLWRLTQGRSASATNDLIIYALNFVGLWKYLSVLLSFGAVLIVGIVVGGVVHTLVQFDLRIRTGSLVLDTFLGFLLFTFCDYWNHRLQHRQPLWPLHRVHHAADEMTVLTLWRTHPTIAAVEPLFKLWPLAVFDVPAETVAVIAMLTVTYVHLIHSNIRWDWGWFGRWVLIPPIGHRLHHHIDPENQGKNLGIPVLWDRLFGTWDGRYPPDDRLGISDMPYNRSMPREMWRDLVDFLRESKLFVVRQFGHAASKARRFRH